MAWYRSSGIQYLLVLGARFGSGILNFVLFAVAARAMGGDGFGVFSMMFSAVMFLGMLGALGQQNFLIKEVPRSRVLGDLGQERGAFRFALVVSTLGGLLAAAAVVAWMAWRIEGVAAGSVVSSAVLCFCFTVSQMTLGALRVEGFTVLGLLTRDLLWRVLSVIALIVAAWTGRRAVVDVTPSLAMLILGATLAPILGLHLWLLYRTWQGRWRIVGPRYRMSQWIPLSAGLAILGAVAGTDLYLFTLAAGRVLSPAVAGAIFAAIKCIELISLFLVAVGLVAGPDISKLVAEGDPQRLQRKSNAVLVLQGMPALFVSAGLLLAGPWVLWLFDPGYASFASTLRIFVLGMLVNVLTGATNMLLQLSGLHWQQVIFQVGSLVIALGMLPLLVRWLGPIGVAWCYLIRQLVWNGLAVLLLRRRLGVDPSILALFQGGRGAIGLAVRDVQFDLAQVLKRQTGKRGAASDA